MTASPDRAGLLREAAQEWADAEDAYGDAVKALAETWPDVGLVNPEDRTSREWQAVRDAQQRRLAANDRLRAALATTGDSEGRCPTCGSVDPARAARGWNTTVEPWVRCDDPWHAAAPVERRCANCGVKNGRHADWCKVAAPAREVEGLLHGVLTDVEYLMEEHGTRVIDIEDLRAVVKGRLSDSERQPDDADWNVMGLESAALAGTMGGLRMTDDVFTDDDVANAEDRMRQEAAPLAATGDSEGPLDVEEYGRACHHAGAVLALRAIVEAPRSERLALLDAEYARLSSKGYDKADHAAREGVPEGDLP